MRHALKRTAQLGLLARDIAFVQGRIPGSRRDEARRRLVERLGLMHGLPQKIGQILSFSEIEASDPAYAALTEGEPTLPAAEALAEVALHLGKPVSSLFREFSLKGISASIGQVHRAVLTDGRAVAVKIQYPGVAESVAFDLRALGWLSAPVGDLRRGFDLEAYRSEIGSSLSRELDYGIEARSLERFSELAKTLGGRVVTPELVPEMSSSRVLTTTWLEGVTLSEARHWPFEEREALSGALLELFLNGVLDWGLLHADPNPGNYRFLRRSGRPCVGLLDFGCVTELPPGARAGLAGIIRDAALGISTGRSVKLRLQQAGFSPAVLDRMESRMNSISDVLSEPFALGRPFDVRSWRLGSRLSEALGPDRMAFRTAGPPEILFFLRSFQGLIHHLGVLNAPVDWRLASGIPTNRAEADPSQPAPASQERDYKTVSSSVLRISVIERGETRVSLCYDATAAASLRDLVPTETRGRLESKGIDLSGIAERARYEGFPAGDLFSLTEGEKTVRVWLE